MVLQESIFITTLSGVTGMIFGIALLSNIGDRLEEFFIVDPSTDNFTAIVATVLLILFGAIAGYIPSQKAASIKPIVALRDEQLSKVIFLISTHGRRFLALLPRIRLERNYSDRVLWGIFYLHHSIWCGKRVRQWF